MLGDEWRERLEKLHFRGEPFERVVELPTLRGRLGGRLGGRCRSATRCGRLWRHDAHQGGCAAAESRSHHNHESRARVRCLPRRPRPRHPLRARYGRCRANVQQGAADAYGVVWYIASGTFRSTVHSPGRPEPLSNTRALAISGQPLVQCIRGSARRMARRSIHERTTPHAVSHIRHQLLTSAVVSEPKLKHTHPDSPPKPAAADTRPALAHIRTRPKCRFGVVSQT